MQIALVHDHLAQDGGAEKVLKALAEIFPEAPIYTLLYDRDHMDPFFQKRKIEASIIQKLPGGIKHYQWYMPFMPIAVEFFDLRHFDVVISDASAFAKGVITSPDALHISYCHTPTRYLWDYTHQYINELKYNKFVKKVISLVLNYIRMWDFQAAGRVDKFIANSETVRRRIKKYYRADSLVIHPPVDTHLGNISSEIGDYYLIGGRLAPYKRVDIVIKAFIKMKRKLKIFGSGVDMDRLKSIADDSPWIEFLGRVDDKTKFRLYENCRGFLNPQEEDFGITPVEAMSCGRPVIAFAKGGATETVVDKETGIYFYEQHPDAIIKAVLEAENKNFHPETIRRQAMKFSEENFKEKIKKYIWEEYKKFKEK